MDLLGGWQDNQFTLAGGWKSEKHLRSDVHVQV